MMLLNNILLMNFQSLVIMGGESEPYNIYTVIHKKRCSNFVIITLENLIGFNNC